MSATLEIDSTLTDRYQTTVPTSINEEVETKFTARRAAAQVIAKNDNA